MVSKKKMVLQIIADFQEGDKKIIFFSCAYRNLCGLITKSNKRGQIFLALTGQSGFPTSSFQQLNCIVQIHTTAAKGKLLPELLLY